MHQNLLNIHGPAIPSHSACACHNRGNPKRGIDNLGSTETPRSNWILERAAGATASWAWLTAQLTPPSRRSDGNSCVTLVVYREAGTSRICIHPSRSASTLSCALALRQADPRTLR